MNITTRKLKNKDGTTQHFIMLTQTGRECLYPLPPYALRDSEAKAEIRKIEERLRDWIDGAPNESSSAAELGGKGAS